MEVDSAAQCDPPTPLFLQVSLLLRRRNFLSVRPYHNPLFGPIRRVAEMHGGGCAIGFEAAHFYRPEPVSFAV